MKYGSIRNRSAAEIPTQVGDLKPEVGRGAPPQGCATQEGRRGARSEPSADLAG